MPTLTALRSLTGDYGTVREGEQFETSEEQAVSLESRGLAMRYRPPVPLRPPLEPYQTKVIVPENPRKRRANPRT